MENVIYSELKGKKLLYLGGVKRACNFVERARQLGVYVIVADYLEDSPAKKVADEGVLLDATDVDAIVEFCKERKIDGITTAYLDLLMPICCEVSKRLGLPYYATEKMIELSTDKKVFKDTFRKYGIPVPCSYDINPNDLDNEAEKITYPVFVKPLDGSGSRGANVCRNRDEFIENYRAAEAFSKTDRVMVEEYLTGTDIGADFLIVNGKAHFLSMWDRKICKGRPVAVNHADFQLLPSSNIDLLDGELSEKICSAFSDLGFENGIVFLQGYANNGEIKFFEMGARLGGTWAYIDEYYSGINPIDMLIHHALTGKMCESYNSEKINPRFSGKAAVVNFVSEKKSGTITEIKGLEEAKKSDNVVYCFQFYNVGDDFDIGTVTDVHLLSFRIVAENLDELKRVVNNLYSTVEINDEDGSILSEFYDVEEL